MFAVCVDGVVQNSVCWKRELQEDVEDRAVQEPDWCAALSSKALDRGREKRTIPTRDVVFCRLINILPLYLIGRDAGRAVGWWGAQIDHPDHDLTEHEHFEQDKGIDLGVLLLLRR